MSISILERETIANLEVDNDLFPGELPGQAQATLGYGRLLAEQAATRRRNALWRTLAELDVLPFTGSSVEAYKQACARRANRRIAEAALATVGLSALVALVALPLLLFTALFGFANAAFYSALAFSAGTVIAVAAGVVESRYSVEREWTMRELSDYAEPVPEFVLQTAVEVKQAHPDAEFHVCTLEENRVVVDPFLVLRIQEGGAERDYYLEVWNESRFDGRREA
ncbi:MAG: hypothetical protein DWQ34_14475 [Planctomycetota bacterium]|nr:MAG: hypothetical protein DWQ34_14475 [Planctomycetota bacterium]REK19986.1 MAG: hypothetical protein DWQ41_27075 [Planctomycetota bacterium]REK27553.1 MAG: hypothetical protein DWQ45_26095 [Planctomycetota bacterium]